MWTQFGERVKALWIYLGGKNKGNQVKRQGQRTYLEKVVDKKRHQTYNMKND